MPDSTDRPAASSAGHRTADSSSNNQSYAQAASGGASASASASAGVSEVLYTFGPEDVDPLDHLEALRTYEGEVEGNRWPRAEDLRQRERVRGMERSRRMAQAASTTQPLASISSLLLPTNHDGWWMNDDPTPAEMMYGDDGGVSTGQHSDRHRRSQDTVPWRSIYTHGNEPISVGNDGAGGDGEGNVGGIQGEMGDENGIGDGTGEAAPIPVGTGQILQIGDDVLAVPIPFPISNTPGALGQFGPRASAATGLTSVGSAAPGGVYHDVMQGGWGDFDPEVQVRRVGRGHDEPGQTDNTDNRPNLLASTMVPLRSSQSANDNATGLARGGNNRRRNMIGEIIARHILPPSNPAPPLTDAVAESFVQSMQRDWQQRYRDLGESEPYSTQDTPALASAPNYRPLTPLPSLLCPTRPSPPARHLPTLSRTSAPPPLIRSSNPTPPAAGTSLFRLIRARSASSGSGSGSKSGPEAKRRKLINAAQTEENGKTEEKAMGKETDPKSNSASSSDSNFGQEIDTPALPSRPSYLSYSTLAPDAILPEAFTPPARDSHLALTTYDPVRTTASLSSSTSSTSPISTSGNPPTSTSDHKHPSLPSTSAPPPPQQQISFTSRPSATARPRVYADADASSLRTLSPIPSGTGIHYWEITVLDSGPEGYMSLGWVMRGVNMARLVGWEKGTWGFHADDGRAFEGRGTGKVFGETWGVGDVIGAGIDFTTRRAFFTKNGKLIGHVFKNLPLAGLHPAVGFRNPRESVAVNFLGPFVYDIDRHVLGIRNGVLADVGSRAVIEVPSLPLIPHTTLRTNTSPASRIMIQETILGSRLATSPSGPNRLSRPISVAFRSTPPPPPIGVLPTLSADQAEQEESVNDLLPATSDLREAARLAQMGFVLDYLGHNGMDRVKALVVDALEQRKAVLLPGVRKGEVEGKGKGKEREVMSAAKKIEGLCEVVIKGQRIPWGHDIPLEVEGWMGKGGEGLWRKLRLLDMVAMVNPTVPREKEDKMVVEEVEMDEEAMAAAKGLMGIANNQQWDEGERGWLNEAFAVVCGLPEVSAGAGEGAAKGEEGVWGKRRVEWTRDLRAYLREHNGLKPRSHLEQALRYSQALTATLAEGIDSSGAFVDAKAFVQGYGRKEVVVVKDKVEKNVGRV